MALIRSRIENLLEEELPRVLSLLILSYLQIEEKYAQTWGRLGAEGGEFKYPASVSMLCSESSSEIAVVDCFNHRIQVFTLEGKFLRMWGNKGSRVGEFEYPFDIASLSPNEVAVADMNNHRIQVFTPEGKFLRMWGKRGKEEGEFNCPCGIASLSPNEVAVADMNNHRIQVFSSRGKFLRMWGKEGSEAGELRHPRGITLLSSGSSKEVAVADAWNYRIQVFTPEGKFLRMWGEGLWQSRSKAGEFHYPYGITSLPSGEVIVADKLNNRIQVFSPKGKFLRMLETYGDSSERFFSPIGVAALYGSSEGIIIADTDNHRIHVFQTVFN